MSLFEIITLGVAIWGAGLSSLLAWREYRKDKRKLMVSCNVAGMPYPPGDATLFIVIQVTNVGHRPVTINAGGFELSDGRTFTDFNSKAGPLELPVKLEDGDDVTLLFDYDKMKRVSTVFAKQKLHFKSAFVRDTEGKVYKAKLPPDNEIFGINLT